MTAQEAQSLALGAAGSTATASGAAGSTALVPIVLPPTLVQANPEDQQELARLLAIVTERNRLVRGGFRDPRLAKRAGRAGHFSERGG